MPLRLEIPVGEAGESLAVRVDGADAAPPPPLTVLYFHGFGSRQSGEKAEFFRRSVLAAGLPFASLDFRGHGDSGGDMRGVTLSRQLEDALAARRALEGRGHRRFALLGSSFGGLTGLWHAALHPESVVAGLHLAPALGLGEEIAAQLGPEGVERWRREGARRFANDLGSWDIGWGFVADFEAYPDARLAGLQRTPALLFQGALDDQVAWRRVRDFAAACPDGRVELVLYEDGDHRLTDRLEEIWKRMRDFFKKVGA